MNDYKRKIANVCRLSGLATAIVTFIFSMVMGTLPRTLSYTYKDGRITQHSWIDCLRPICVGILLFIGLLFIISLICDIFSKESIFAKVNKVFLSLVVSGIMFYSLVFLNFSVYVYTKTEYQHTYCTEYSDRGRIAVVCSAIDPIGNDEFLVRVFRIDGESAYPICTVTEDYDMSKGDYTLKWFDGGVILYYEFDDKGKADIQLATANWNDG